MLIPMDVILKDARDGNYAVPAPGIHDMQSVEAVFQGAHELKSPVILDVNERHDLNFLCEVAEYYAKKYPRVIAAINLDHGSDYSSCVRAVRAGFTSVMIDCSTLPFEDNVEKTAEVVRLAHSVGVSVEAELGHVGRGSHYEEDRDAALTIPEEAVEFVRTSVDCLAVTVGTAHGLYSGTPKLDFERLSELRQAVSVPLVLHGGSSTGDENLSQAARTGICKVNLWTDLMVAGTDGIVKFLTQNKTNFRPLSAVYAAGIEAYKNELMHYMEVLGCAGKG